jgi:hypothetical protein
MVVGIGSLFIIIYQTQLMRESQHASVMPYLMIALQSNSDGVFMNLSNTGIGPALIDEVTIRYQGKELKADPFDFYASLDTTADLGPLDADKVMPGRLIPAGTTVRMIGKPGPDNQAMIYELLRLFAIGEVPRSSYLALGLDPEDGRAIFEVKYSSVYGDSWRLDSAGYVPEPL